MERKQIPARLYYYASTILTAPEIPTFADKTAEPLFQSAQAHQLELAGPSEFIYLNTSDDPAKPFQLIIGLPVTKLKAAADDFGFLETASFDCVHVDFKGPMVKIGNAWETFVQQALAAGYLLGNQGREVYKDWHAFDSNDNLTELQMGVVGRSIRVA